MTLLAGGAGQSDHPPTPRLALAIGVVGHRPNRLPQDGAQLAAVKGEIGRVLDMLKREVEAVLKKDGNFFAPGQPMLSVVSALAQGADTMVATAAAERGFALDAPLPFPREVYEADFVGPEARSTYRDFLHKARSVLELPGDRAAQAAAYEAAGLTVLANSDLIISVWDQGLSAGAGGTADMMKNALGLRIPIVSIDANGVAPTRIIWRPYGETKTNEDAELGEDLSLSTLIAHLLTPPAHREERKGYTRYLNERSPSFSLRLEFPLLLATFLLRSVRKEDWRPRSPASLTSDYLANLSDLTSDPQQKTAALAFGWADSIAIHYAQVLRSAIIANFLLPATAVIVAVSSLLFPHEVKHNFVGAELVLLVLVLANSNLGGRQSWDRRWYRAREVAERLRVMWPLWLLGVRPNPFIDPQATWATWYARAIARASVPRSGLLTPDAIERARSVLIGLLKDQIRYHENNARLMGALEQRLEWVARAAFYTVALTGLAYLAVWWAGYETPDPLLYGVTAVAAGLPAIENAITLIRLTADFRGTEQRSRSMRFKLRPLIDAIEHDRRDLLLLRSRAYTAADAMLGDTSNWRLAAENRELTIPG